MIQRTKRQKMWWLVGNGLLLGAIVIVLASMWNSLWFLPLTILAMVIFINVGRPWR